MKNCVNYREIEKLIPLGPSSFFFPNCNSELVTLTLLNIRFRRLTGFKSGKEGAIGAEAGQWKACRVRVSD